LKGDGPSNKQIQRTRPGQDGASSPICVLGPMTPRRTVPSILLLVTLVLISQPLAVSSDGPTSESLRIDHVIVGVADLDYGMRRFEELTGVRPVVGGDSPGRGARNALASLGSGRYLELLAPRGDASPSPDIDRLRQLKDLTPLRWAVSTSQAEMTVRRLKQLGYAISDPLPGSRVKPDGNRLNWVRYRIDRPELAHVCSGRRVT
jgi:hypothetical protein